MYVVAVVVKTKQTFRLPDDCHLMGFWRLLATTSDKWMHQISSEMSYLYSSTYGTQAGTYPNQSGYTTRSTSFQRRRKLPTECGDRSLPPAARSNSPWPHTGRRPPLLCSSPTGEPGHQWLIALQVNVNKCNSITIQMMKTNLVSSGRSYTENVFSKLL